MRIFLFLILFLNYGNTEESKPHELLSLSKHSDSLAKTQLQPIFQKASEEVLYFSVGAVFGSASFLSKLGGEISLMTPGGSTTGLECLLLSELCDSVSSLAFAQMSKTFSSKDPLLFPPSQNSWHLNEENLSQIPISSENQEKLLLFLKRRWLAKSTGFTSSLIDWVCPCFGVDVQVHPETDGSYARSPAIQFSSSYKNRVKDWKEILPHPFHFPLILTRPCDLQNYLPSYFKISKEDSIQDTLRKMALSSNPIVDLTDVIEMSSETKWLENWGIYQALLIKNCKELNIDTSRIICIQRLQQEEIGAIRLLPFFFSSTKKIEQDHRFLVEWVSTFGLSANRIELDRCDTSKCLSIQETTTSLSPLTLELKESILSQLNFFDLSLLSDYPEKALMMKGSLAVLKGLLSSLSDETWNEITSCPTKAAILQLSFSNIEKQLQLLEEDQKTLSFFDLVSHLEQIHASLTPLLEIFSPFTFNDFPSIYKNLLTSIPQNLKSLTSCGLHTSGMTNLAGILKSVEKATGTSPLVLYGENIYYECVNAAKKTTRVFSIEEATNKDFLEVDLILAQFNPALKRIDLPPSSYQVENVAEVLHKALKPERTKPLTLALDCTLDLINSPQVSQLLNQFPKELEAGTLNIICYRSGLKFDLFGMDNYCGAPIFTIHNKDPKWAPFNSLLTDPALQTDKLSLNWFCLAYQNAAPELELYRKQIFQNTRALLNKVPARLISNQNLNYRIVPVESGVDAAFIDIKVSGAFHEIRAAALVAGCLYLKCMEGGHPIFHRITVGLYHPNFTMIFGEDNSTIRLTLGLDPSQVDLLAECFERIDKLNGL